MSCANVVLAQPDDQELVALPVFINLASEEIRYEANEEDRNVNLAQLHGGDFNADYWRGRLAETLNAPRVLVHIDDLDEELAPPETGSPGARQVTVRHMEFPCSRTWEEAQLTGDGDMEAFVFQGEYRGWHPDIVEFYCAIGGRGVYNMRAALLKWPIDDRHDLLEIVREHARMLEFASERLRDDAEVVREAVQTDGRALRFASARLREDPEVVTAAIQTGYGFESTSDRLRDNRDVALAAVQRPPYPLELVSDRLRDDREVVLKALARRPLALEFASERLRDDAELVLVAVRGDGYALQFASERLRDDIEVVLQSVQTNRCALEFASERLRGQEELVLQAVREAAALEFESERLR